MTNNPKDFPPPPPPEVYNYLMKELWPLQKEVFPFWQELLKLRITIWEAFRRNKLNEYQEKYNGFSSRWINAKEKVNNLDKLISPNDKEGEKKLAITVTADYLKEMEAKESGLTRIMNDLSNTLRDKRTEADFKAAISLSTAAIMLGIISVIVSAFT
jgi:hypothetical protein